MTVTPTATGSHRLPGPRPFGATPPTADELRAAAYQEFAYGYGIVPGLDLGAPVRYTKNGSVFRQEFERGLTVANVGDAEAEIVLDGPHEDAAGVRRTVLTLPPRSAEVLHSA